MNDLRDGRDRMTGRFGPGNKAGHSGPTRRRMQELRTELMNCASPEAVKEVFHKLYTLAMGGDVQAAKLWLEHLVGKPTQAVELSGPGGEPLGSKEKEYERIMQIMADTIRQFPEAGQAVAAALMASKKADNAAADTL